MTTKINSQGDTNIGGDVVGGDKTTIIYNGTSPYFPSELPHRRSFFGREEQLAQIVAALKPEAIGWGVLIDGAVGIGKTALALEAAHRTPKNQFIAKIFLSAKKYELTLDGKKLLDDFRSQNYDALLSDLARLLGNSEIQKANPKDRPRFVRDLLNKRQVLLVIDSIDEFTEDERNRLYQFLGFLPQSCKAIVTSRYSTNLLVHNIHLNPLCEEELLSFVNNLAEQLANFAPATMYERKTLYHLANGNLQILIWLATQFGRKNSKYGHVQYLSKNIQVEDLFDDVWQTLSREEKSVLSMLVSYGFPAKESWLQSVLNLNEYKMKGILYELLRRSLINLQSHQIFTVHPMVGELIKGKHPDEVVSAQISMYIHSVLNRQKVSAKHNKSTFKPIRLSFSQQLTLLNWVGKNYDDVVKAFATFITSSFYENHEEMLKTNPDSLVHMTKTLLESSEKVGFVEMSGAMSVYTAWLLLQQKKGHEGLPYAHRAVEIFTKLGSPNLESAQKILAECEKTINELSKGESDKTE